VQGIVLLVPDIHSLNLLGYTSFPEGVRKPFEFQAIGNLSFWIGNSSKVILLQNMPSILPIIRFRPS
jgi:hypothetical protein